MVGIRLVVAGCMSGVTKIIMGSIAAGDVAVRDVYPGVWVSEGRMGRVQPAKKIKINAVKNSARIFIFASKYKTKP